ncbi:MAG: RNA methyltransferase [bacterium]
MLSQNQIKHITSLKSKKFREEYRQFIAEGHKLVTDLMESPFSFSGIYASAEWIVGNLKAIQARNIPSFETTPREMERISALSNPSNVLAVLEIPSPSPGPSPVGEGKGVGLSLALDDIRDPGNMGTIIRTADWFGIGTIICSGSCVDLYNPKVVQATMGSITRVRVFYEDLEKYLAEIKGPAPIYGAFLEGEDLYTATLSAGGIILIGNEAHGISPALEKLVTRKISIPSYGKAESLNASVAAAVICAEFRRRTKE